MVSCRCKAAAGMRSVSEQRDTDESVTHVRVLPVSSLHPRLRDGLWMPLAYQRPVAIDFASPTGAMPPRCQRGPYAVERHRTKSRVEVTLFTGWKLVFWPVDWHTVSVLRCGIRARSVRL